MTRAASGAQRSGAAAVIIILRERREYLVPRDEYFVSSFFAPRAPARWQQGKIGVSWLQPTRPGSVVLVGPGSRTGYRTSKFLKIHPKSASSVVLAKTLTRDARADTPAHTRHARYQNHRTIEPEHKIHVSHEVIGSVAVLWHQNTRTGAGLVRNKASNLNPLPVLASNKQWGGYCLIAFAVSSGPDQGLFGGSAGRNFRRPVRAVGGAGAPVEAVAVRIAVARENGGIPPFFGGATGRVGTGTLERAEIAVSFQRLADWRIQPAGLSMRCPAEGPGGRSADLGGIPPSRASIVSRPFAQPIFRVSSAFQIRCDALSLALDRDGRNLAMRKTGTGVSGLPCAAGHLRGRAQSNGCQMRVGENGFSLGRGRSRTLTLGGEGQGVN